jgi:hypothetical protein
MTSLVRYMAPFIGVYIYRVGARIDKNTGVINGVAVEYSDGTIQLDPMFDSVVTNPTLPDVDNYITKWATMPGGFDKVVCSTSLASQYADQLASMEFYRNSIKIAQLIGGNTNYINTRSLDTSDLWDPAVGIDIMVFLNMLPFYLSVWKLYTTSSIAVVPNTALPPLPIHEVDPSTIPPKYIPPTPVPGTPVETIDPVASIFINKVGARINKTFGVINGLAVEYNNGIKQMNPLFANNHTTDPYMADVSTGSPGTYEETNNDEYVSYWVDMPDGFDKVTSKISKFYGVQQLSIVTFYRKNKIVAIIDAGADHDFLTNMELWTISYKRIAYLEIVIYPTTTSFHTIDIKSVSEVYSPIPPLISIPVHVDPVPSTPIPTPAKLTSSYFYLLILIAFIFVCVIYSSYPIYVPVVSINSTEIN